jgi:hypothetical protein
MSAYAPTVIPLNGPLDGDVIDANFDAFQAATGGLNAANLTNTDGLEFRNLHLGASSETFAEYGAGTTPIYNTFSQMSAGQPHINPYPDEHNLAEDHQADTEVCFVARASGVAYVTSTASIFRPKAGWVTGGKNVFLMAECWLAYAVGLPRYPGGSALDSNSIARNKVQWSTGVGPDKRVGQEIRLSGELPIVAGQRYSFWLNIRLFCQTITALNGTDNPETSPVPVTTGSYLCLPTTCHVVSIKGGSRHTAVTCIYR